MKMMKRFLTIGLSFLLTLCISVSFVGCELDINDKESVFIYGDFRYCYVDKVGARYSVKKDKAIGVNILDLVGEAKEKETIVIPETIDGLPVIAIGMEGLGWGTSLKQQGVRYKKLYLPNSLLFVSDSDDIWDGAGRKKIFFYDDFNSINWENRITLLQNIDGGFGEIRIFVPEILYQDYQNLEGINILNRIHIANVTYIVDDEIYWIDDYNNGEYIKFPTQPIKQGYVFDGWYKDEGFFEEWIEEIDQYQKSQDSISIKLYAKFV